MKMKQIHARLIKNFASQDEMRALNKWTLLNYKNMYFYDAKMDKNLYERTRLTTRLENTEDFNELGIQINYPPESYRLQKKIIKSFGLDNCKSPSSFYKGIVNGIGFEKGSICNHIDPEYYPGTKTLHCNIVTQKPLGGGDLIIDGRKFEVEEGDLMCYLVSEHYHEVTSIIGPKERILWVFGFCIDEDKVKQIFMLK